MAWYDRVVDWATPYIDQGAEYLGYVDDYAGTGEDAFYQTAGEQFMDDASDIFGFVKQGAKAYKDMNTIMGADGKPVRQQPFQKTQAPRPRTLGQMGLGSSRGSANFQVSQTQMGTGYSNPNVQTAMSALLANSYNSQMNQMLAQFTVNPNIRQGRTYGAGATTIKGTSSSRKRVV
jgi:hypothetical protein